MANNIAKIRQYCTKHKVTAPWQESYSKPLEKLSDNYLRELLEPWNVFYASQKTFKFTSDRIKMHLKNNPGWILDVGCGTGNLCRFLAKQNTGNIEGCDISNSAIQFAKVISLLEKLPIRFTCKNFTQYDSQDQRYSVIILNAVLEHIVEYKQWIRQIHKLLNENGIVFIVVPSILGAWSIVHDINWHTFRWKAQPYNYHPGMHCNHFWFRQLIKEFADHGLQLDGVFKMQAFNALAILPFRLLNRGWWMYKFYTVLDYWISKILPNDIATRVVVFRKI